MLFPNVNLQFLYIWQNSLAIYTKRFNSLLFNIIIYLNVIILNFHYSIKILNFFNKINIKILEQNFKKINLPRLETLVSHSFNLYTRNVHCRGVEQNESVYENLR